MTNYKQITLSDIINGTQSKGAEATEMLKQLVVSTSVDKNGNERPLSFIQIRKAYYEKYYPQYLPKAKEKAPSMKDLILAL